MKKAPDISQGLFVFASSLLHQHQVSDKDSRQTVDDWVNLFTTARNNHRKTVADKAHSHTVCWREAKDGEHNGKESCNARLLLFPLNVTQASYHVDTNNNHSRRYDSGRENRE